MTVKKSSKKGEVLQGFQAQVQTRTDGDSEANTEVDAETTRGARPHSHRFPVNPPEYQEERSSSFDMTQEAGMASRCRVTPRRTPPSNSSNFGPEFKDQVRERVGPRKEISMVASTTRRICDKDNGEQVAVLPTFKDQVSPEAPRRQATRQQHIVSRPLQEQLPTFKDQVSPEPPRGQAARQQNIVSRPSPKQQPGAVAVATGGENTRGNGEIPETEQANTAEHSTTATETEPQQSNGDDFLINAYLVEQGRSQVRNDFPFIEAQPLKRRSWLIAGVLLFVLLIAAVVGAVLGLTLQPSNNDEQPLVTDSTRPPVASSSPAPTQRQPLSDSPTLSPSTASPSPRPVLYQQLGNNVRGSANDYLGTSVALSSDGTIVATGAIQKIENGSGYVDVYAWVDEEKTWKRLGATIMGEAAGNQFGQSVALSGDGGVLAVGAPYAGPDRAGTVSVFQYENDTVWSPIGNVIGGEVEGDEFGWSVSLSNDSKRLAIGAPQNDDQSGKVTVYEIVDATSWKQIGLDIKGEAYLYGQAGWSVSLSSDGKRLAVGEHTYDSPYDESGKARMFEFVNGDWQQLGQAIATEDRHDLFGSAISLSGDGGTVAIAGENVPTSIYSYDDEGNWTQLGRTISGLAPSLSRNGRTIAVGHHSFGMGGVVQVFQYQNNTWTQVGADISGQSTGERFGTAVSLDDSGMVVAVGSPLYGSSGYFGEEFTGALRVFRLKK